MPPRRKKPAPKSAPESLKLWSMYSTHHDAVSDSLEENGLFFEFHEDDDSDCEKEYDTNITGRFTCHNRTCSKNGWSSMVVPITIRMYPGEEYNARVYHQRCKACNELSKPRLNETYAERVAYRLKKWCGVRMKPPPYSDKITAPHENELCEGCKHGHCKG
jgi:hypothetical protein